MEYNIYCDESCHLENDGINDMSIGAIWVPKSNVYKINSLIREIKIKNTKINILINKFYLDFE